MIHGSCACGVVRFEVDKVRAITTCLPQHEKWVPGYEPKSS